MERSFSKRDKRVQLQELTDLVATKEGEALSDVSAENLMSEISPDQVKAFEKAGWKFQKRLAQKASELKNSAKVFVKKGGRLALGTNYITVQLKDYDSKESADRELKPFGLKVVEELSFAPGLVRAALANDSVDDVIDVVNKLAQSDNVIFAEPDLIEITGPR